MTDKKFTDEEIIKRLEKCVKRGNRNYDTDIVLDLINRQKAEIERLKQSLNIELENFATEYDNKIKSEAVKEFAERLKTEYAKGMSWFKKKESYYVDAGDIDNLVKEMVGEDNA